MGTWQCQVERVFPMMINLIMEIKAKLNCMLGIKCPKLLISLNLHNKITLQSIITQHNDTTGVKLKKSLIFQAL